MNYLFLIFQYFKTVGRITYKSPISQAVTKLQKSIFNQSELIICSAVICNFSLDLGQVGGMPHNVAHMFCWGATERFTIPVRKT